MARLERLTTSEASRFARSPVKCPRTSLRIDSLADYFATISTAITAGASFWFRGHADVNWSLTPYALRFRTVNDRARALGLLSDFKRIAGLKLPRPPQMQEELLWVQLAQHYG